MFEILYDNEKKIRKDIEKIPTTQAIVIKKTIEAKLRLDPMATTRPLKGSKHGLRRLRVGDYRVVFHIDHKKGRVIINTIRHRKNVYG